MCPLQNCAHKYANVEKTLGINIKTLAVIFPKGLLVISPSLSFILLYVSFPTMVMLSPI